MKPSENIEQRNRWLLRAVTIGIVPALVAVLIAITYFRERSPAPLEPRLGKLVHDVRADVPVYHAWIIRMFSARKAAWVPDRWVKRAYAEAERASARRGRAASELWGMGTNAWAAIPALLQALKSRNPEIRYTAAVVLGRIKAGQAPEFDWLKPCLRDQERPADVFGFLLTGQDEFSHRWEQDIRCFALTGLTAMGPGARSKLGMMLEILRSKEEDNEIRVKASEVIYSIGPAGEGGVAVLKQIFQDPEEWPVVRAGAARALAGAAPSDPQLRSLLRPALGNSPALVRIAAAETLWQLGSPAAEVLPVLAEGLGHKLATVRLAALKAVTRMGKAAQPIASAVRTLLSDEKEPVRQAAAATLASMGLKKEQDSKDGYRGIR
jgi:HEAT repeat protein